MRLASVRTLTALFAYLDTIGVAARDVADSSTIALVQACGASERIPARLPIAIMERCAVRLDEPLFGLKYAQALDPKSFGPISLFWRFAPTLRYNTSFSSRILHMHQEGVVVGLTVGDDEAAFVYGMDPELRQDARQFVETNLSFAMRICRWIVGAGWSPIRVTFAHAAACDPVRYAEILNAPVSFGAAGDAVIVRPADLDRKSANHDPELLEFIERSLTSLAGQEPLDFRERLGRTLEALCAAQSPRLGDAAAMMGLSGRTLQRRLATEGVTFGQLLGDRRRRIIAESLSRPRRPSLARLAEQCGYSDASAVSRFMRGKP